MNISEEISSLEIVKRGLRNSSYIYDSGQKAKSYVNLDTALLENNPAEDKPQEQYKVIESLAAKYIKAINEIESEFSFEKLAFIDKGGHGPVGTIALSTLLIVLSKKEAFFVRPYRNTIRSITKGPSTNENESILIISDVATTGQTIIKAASKLWAIGVKVIGALVFLDHELGAKENLSLNGINLFSIYTRTKFNEESEKSDKRLEKIPIENYKEFGVCV